MDPSSLSLEMGATIKQEIPDFPETTSPDDIDLNLLGPMEIDLKPPLPSPREIGTWKSAFQPYKV